MNSFPHYYYIVISQDCCRAQEIIRTQITLEQEYKVITEKFIPDKADFLSNYKIQLEEDHAKSR